MASLFNVYVDIIGGKKCRCMLRDAEAKDAAATVGHLVKSFEARRGYYQRIIITDSGDCLAWEWTHANGVTDLSTHE